MSDKFYDNKLFNKLIKFGIAIAYIMIIISLTGFLCLLYLENNLTSNQIEKPLIDVKGFVIDKKGVIYVGLGYYGTVQVYDSNGVFIRSWKIDNNGGAFKMKINENENIIITATRGDNEITYNKFGEILNSKKEIGIYSNVDSFKGEFQTSNGDIYIYSNYFYPVISRVFPDSKTIVSQNMLTPVFYKLPINILYLIIYLGYIVISKTYLKKKQAKQITL